MTKEFKKFSPKFSIFPYIMSFFIVIGFLIAEYFMYKQNAPIITIVIFSIFTLIGIIALLKGLLLITSVGYYYGIGKDRIIVSSFFKKREFLFSEINQIVGMTFDQVTDLFYRINNDQLVLAGTGNSVKSLSSGLREIDLRKYSTYTFPKAYGSASINIGKVGFAVWMKAIKINPRKGNIVLIILKNSRMHILTPKDVQGFLQESNKIL